MTSHQANSAQSFINSIGVEVHISYTDGKYANVNSIIDNLKYLGTSLIRTSSLNSAGTLLGQQHYQVIASAGFHFDLVINGNKPIQSSLSQIDSFAVRNPGAVFAIEGPNEIDHQPITYNLLTGGPAAIAFQNDLYAAVRSDPILANVNIYSFSLGSGATPTGGYDAVALHPYPQNGDEPLKSILSNLRLAPTGHQSVLSEFGYSSLPSWWMGVDQLTQAKETLNGLFDAKALGVQATYLYELLDAYADPTDSFGGRHYGLFDYSNNPKPVAVALHNLTSILADPNSAQAAVSESLDYIVSNLPSSASSLLFEKSDETFDIVVWNEPDIWNQSNHTTRAAVPITIGIDLSATASTIRVYDPLLSAAPLQSLLDSNHVDVSLSDHPVIIELHRVAGSSPSIEAIEGTAGNDVLQGLAGVYSMAGHAGNDVYYVSNSLDKIIEKPSEGTDRVIASVSFALQAGQSVEQLYTSMASGTLNIDLQGNELSQRISGNAGYNKLDGKAGNDQLSGLAGDDDLLGGAGDDSLMGGAGTNLLQGGPGNDKYFVTSLTDHIIENAADGIDSISSMVSFGLAANVENLSLAGSLPVDGTGNDLDNRISGNAAANTLLGGDGDDTLAGLGSDDALLGGPGNDHLNGGTGADNMRGGDGDDLYVVDNQNDTVTELADGGIDTVSSTVTFTIGANVENLKLSGTNDISGFGNSLNNKISGNSMANALDGWIGADTIFGGAGNDTISGGSGTDKMTGGDGSDSFLIARNDSASEVYDVITDFKHGVDKIDLLFLPSIWHGEGYVDGWVASNAYHTILDTASMLMANTNADIAFIAGKSNGWLFWDDAGDHRPDHAVMLTHLGAEDLATYLAHPAFSIDDVNA